MHPSYAYYRYLFLKLIINNDLKCYYYLKKYHRLKYKHDIENIERYFLCFFPNGRPTFDYNI